MEQNYLVMDNAGGRIIAPDWASIASLTKKLAVAAGAMFAVQKDGRNEYQKYAYVSYEEVAATIRRALSSAGVAFTITQDEPKLTVQERAQKDPMQIAQVRVEMTFADAETGAMKVVVAYGEGSDTQDKAISKALTSAVKYGLMRTFLLSTRDDVDADVGDTPAKQNGPTQQPPAEQPLGPDGKPLHWIDDPKTRVAFWNWARTAQGMAEADVYKALEVEHIHNFTGDKAAALAKIVAWLEKQRANVPANESQQPKPKTFKDDGLRLKLIAWAQNDLGLSIEQLREALGVKDERDFEGTKEDAKAIVVLWKEGHAARKLAEIETEAKQ